MKQRLVALAGPPCSGKSTIGGLLAGILGLDFMETDNAVERMAGESIGLVFLHQGEKGFRTLEIKAVEELFSHGERVVALGGGTLLDDSCRETVLSTSRLFTLSVPDNVIMQRNREGRPLAATATDLRRLLEARRAHYASLPGRFTTMGMSPEEAAKAMAGILRKEDPALWSL